MVLDTDKIKELILDGVSEQITLARKKSKRLNMHVTGRGMLDYLEAMDSYETEAQKILRDKLAKSNKSNFSFILRPTDKIFTAKGGAVNYNVKQSQIEEIKDKVSNIADGLDIKNYLKKVVKKHYVVDPNGILFCDINEDGEIETYVINTDQILWYESKGNRVEAIIFEGYINEDDPNDNNTYYRVIDSKNDYLFYTENGEVYEQERSRMNNYFGYVPALILGDEKSVNYDIFESVVSDLVDDADQLLRRMSINNVHELAHLYPRYWSYAQACTRCQGEGEVIVSKDPIVSETCGSCGGTGQKTRTNPSDEVVVPFPQDGDPVIGRLMGFESPDINTARFYREIIVASRDDMFRAMWGTTYQTAGKRETATGRFIDAAPVVDRLSDISYTFSKMHKFLLDCYGKVLLRNPQYESSVTYGTRYVFEGPDDILKRYMESSRENVSDLTRLDMQMRYIEAEYKDDPLELAKRKKLSQIEPFPTLSAEKVLESQYIPEQLKTEKMLFPMWVQTVKTEQIVLRKLDDLREMFSDFVQSKSVTVVTINPQEE